MSSDNTTPLNLRIFVAALALSLALSSPSLARNTVVGVSTMQSPEALKGQLELLINHLTKTLKPGEHALFFDASRVRLIATFIAPTGSGAGNPRVMLNSNRQALGELKKMIDAAEPIPGRIGQINLPAFLRALRQNYPAGENGTDLIALASPITDDSQAPSLSMRDGRIPNDTHIAANAAQSIYGTTGIPGSLAGYDVYFGIIGDPWKVSNEQSHYMERFWALEAEGHGASLSYFHDDLNTLFGLAGHDAADRSFPEPLASTDKLEMLQFARDDANVPDIFTQPLQVAPAPEPMWKAALNPRFGITWIDAPLADLDLYIRPTPASPVIFFGQAQTNEGTLFKDFTNSPASTNGFETVALNGSFDLSALRLAVNFYGGQAPAGSVKGELRIAIGAQVWARAFTIETANGNGGAGAESVFVDGNVSDAHWVMLDPLAVITE